MGNSSLTKKLARSLKWHVKARSYRLVELEDSSVKAGFEVETTIPESTILRTPQNFLVEIMKLIFQSTMRPPSAQIVLYS